MVINRIFPVYVCICDGILKENTLQKLYIQHQNTLKCMKGGIRLFFNVFKKCIKGNESAQQVHTNSVHSA